MKKLAVQNPLSPKAEAFARDLANKAGLDWELVLLINGRNHGTLIDWLKACSLAPWQIEKIRARTFPSEGMRQAAIADAEADVSEMSQAIDAAMQNKSVLESGDCYLERMSLRHAIANGAKSRCRLRYLQGELTQSLKAAAAVARVESSCQ